jgi:pimeloyl-ACP methyl ester carboxylesterase
MKISQVFSAIAQSSARAIFVTILVCTASSLVLLIQGCTKHSKTTALVSNDSDPQWVAQHHPRAKVALIFVHGIFGDTKGTWTAPNGESFFNLITNDPVVGKYLDAYAFGFTSKMFGTDSFDIQEAADKLQQYLVHDVMPGYQEIVFVGHSMGGLVILRELMTYRLLLERTPLLVFYSVPQSGAEIAAIANGVIHNPGLAQMLPADKDGYLRAMSSEWKSIPPPKPHVTCAYEKRLTNGVLIVGFTAATYFCDEAATPIYADHVTIVKPSKPNDEAVIVLVNALNRYAVGLQFSGRLETPNFDPEGDHLVFRIGSPDAGPYSARLVNAGIRKLRYTIGPIADPNALLIWPDDTPKEIGGVESSSNQASLNIRIGRGAGPKDEYSFGLSYDDLVRQTVFVRPNWQAVERGRIEEARAVVKNIDSLVSDMTKTSKWKVMSFNDTAAPDAVVDAVRNVIAGRDPELPVDAQWVSSADFLNTVNWPGLAVRALKKLAVSFPNEARQVNARAIAESVSARSGDPHIFEDISAASLLNALIPPANAGPGTLLAIKNHILVSPNLAEASAQVAYDMQQLPSLRVFGLSLQGDLLWSKGDLKGAQAAYQAAAVIHRTPSISYRLEQIRSSQVPLGASTPPLAQGQSCPAASQVLNFYSSGTEQGEDFRTIEISNQHGPPVTIKNVHLAGSGADHLQVLKDACSGLTLKTHSVCGLLVKCMLPTGTSVPDVHVLGSMASPLCEERKMDLYFSGMCSTRKPSPPPMVCIGSNCVLTPDPRTPPVSAPSPR